MTTITKAGVTITPDLLLGYTAERPTGAIVHRLASGGTAVTLGGIGLRSGRLELFFATGATAAAAETALGSPGTFTLTETGVTEIGMLFTLGEGSITRTLDDDTRLRWLLTVPFQEVTA